MRLKGISELFYERITVEGFNGESAVRALKRRGIKLHSVKKTDKKTILITLSHKDLKKAFAFFDKSCYNIKKAEPIGFYAACLKVKKGAFVLLAFILFFFFALFSRGVILKISVEGADSEKIISVLREEGIVPFGIYRDSLSARAKLMSLPDVSFAYIEMTGYILRVKIVLSPSDGKLKEGDFLSSADGVIRYISVLSGKQLKFVGDEVKSGEIIVAAENGGAVIAEAYLEREAEYLFSTPFQATLFKETFSRGEIDQSELSFTGEYYALSLRYLEKISCNK